MDSNCNIEGPNMDLTWIPMGANKKRKTSSEGFHMSTAWSTTGTTKKHNMDPKRTRYKPHKDPNVAPKDPTWIPQKHKLRPTWIPTLDTGMRYHHAFEFKKTTEHEQTKHLSRNRSVLDAKFKNEQSQVRRIIHSPCPAAGVI